MIEIFKEKKMALLLALFVLFAGGLALYGKFAGLILLFAFIVFGILSTIWKDKNARFAALGFLLLLSIVNITVNGIKFGIDFSGGTRIPITLENAVSQTTMDEMLQTIKSRASVLGLTEVKVRAVGLSQINVEVPGSNEETIKSIEDVLGHQGVFEGIVDGKIAISGADIMPGTIYSIPVQNLRGGDWGVGFSVTRTGADEFASAAKGKADYPLYMYLDRPNNAVIFITYEDLKGGKPISGPDAAQIASKALLLNGSDIKLFVLDDLDFSNMTRVNNTKAIISSSLSADIKAKITALGYNLSETQNITPSLRSSGTTVSASASNYALEKWEPVGLLSAPLLNKGVTEGTPSYSYQISGVSSGAGSARSQNALAEVKRITAILKGGSLPVQISLGSRTSIPAPLGSQFLQLSVIGVLASIFAIAIFVSLRYRQLKIIAPVLAVSLSELVILVSLLGSFTIDLAAMAGILAAIGVGVDSQIVITDELKKEGKDHAEKLAYAFNIITINVIIAIVVMVPLLFSGMVEIIGFALSTIIGSLLGFLISRPVYALLVERIID